MSTLRGTERGLERMLRRMVALDLNAIDAYRMAILRLSDLESRVRFGGFMGDHERHADALSAVMRERGWTPPTQGDFGRILTRGRILVGQRRGDAGILRAMRATEADSAQAYAQAAERGDLHDDLVLRSLFLAGLDDERRHHAWIERRLVVLSS